jgi:hypothetical protein
LGLRIIFNLILLSLSLQFDEFWEGHPGRKKSLINGIDKTACLVRRIHGREAGARGFAATLKDNGHSKDRRSSKG